MLNQMVTTKSIQPGVTGYQKKKIEFILVCSILAGLRYLKPNDTTCNRMAATIARMCVTPSEAHWSYILIEYHFSAENEVASKVTSFSLFHNNIN